MHWYQIKITFYNLFVIERQLSLVIKQLLIFQTNETIIACIKPFIEKYGLFKLDSISVLNPWDSSHNIYVYLIIIKTH